MTGRRSGTVGNGDNLAVGILLMVLSMAFLSAVDAVSKHLTADFSGIQVAWARYAFHLAPMVLLAGPARLKRMVRTTRPVAQIVRAASLTASAVCIILAFGLMPLADAVAVAFVAPLMIVALSWRFLGEQVGPHRWIAVVVGFGGMLALVWPTGEVFETGTLFAIAAAMFWAIGMIMTRHVRDDDPWSTLFYTALVGTALISLAVPFFWRPPSLAAWGLMLVMGVLGGLAHSALIHAFRHASASLLAPYNYTALVWVTFYGWLLFAELPDAKAAIGAVVIVAAGLYAWHRERVASR